MKKYISILSLVVLAIITSCTAQPVLNAKASLSLRSPYSSKSLEPVLVASIEYIDADTLLWDITLTKTDDGSSEGQGVYEDRIISDTIHGLSIGSWNISLIGHDEKDKTIYTGQLDVVLVEGYNNFVVPVAPTGSKGSICFTNCNFDGTDAILYCVMMDGSPLFSYPVGECTFNDDTGLYEVAETTQKVNSGTHNMQIQYGAHTKNFVLRVEPNMTTYVTYGIYEGKLGLSVSIDKQDALVE